MNAPGALLETRDDQAAISRFFYNSTPETMQGASGHDSVHSASIWALSCGFQEAYKDVLPHPVSIIGRYACTAEGVAVVDEDTYDGAYLRGVLLFDRSEDTDGRLSWQIHVTSLPARKDKLTTSIERISMLITADATGWMAGSRRINGQGRPWCHMGLTAGDRQVDPMQAYSWLLACIAQAGTEEAAATYRQQQLQQAANIHKEEMKAADKERFLKSEKRRILQEQLAKTGFAAGSRIGGHTLVFSALDEHVTYPAIG